MTFPAGHQMLASEVAALANRPSEILAGLGSQFGWVLVAGTTAWSAAASAGVSQAVVFGVTFSAVPIVTCYITVNSNKRWDHNGVGLPTVTGMTIRIQQIDNALDTANGFIEWYAFGPL